MEFFFGEHHLDIDRRELRRGADLIAVEPQVFDLLIYLVRNRDRVVNKDDLLASVWGGRIVSESTLTSHIHAVRKAVGDSGEAQRLILTVPRKGYRFVGTVQEVQRARRLADLPNEPPTASISHAPAAPRLSIVVLPFTSLSDSRDQQYFADAITDDLTTDLAQIEHMVVISRNTAFAYRSKSVGTKQIGRELGVRYVLEGGIQQTGDRIRVNVQLIDAVTDTHLWAEKFDRSTSDLFALQNEITLRVTNTLRVILEAVEASHPTERPDVLDFILRGRSLWRKWPAHESYAQAISAFEHALVLDPHSVEAQTWLARVLVHRVLREQTDNAAVDLARAEDLVEHALAASPLDWHAHYVRGQVLSAETRWREAIPEFERVTVLNPNFLSAYANLGWCKFWTGSMQDVIPLQEHVIRLHKRDPFLSVLHWRIGVVHLVQSHTDEAIAAFEKARAINPALVHVHAYLAAAHGLKGEAERAAGDLAEARRLSRDNRYSSIARLEATENFGAPKVRALFQATYFTGLREAGMPEK